MVTVVPNVAVNSVAKVSVQVAQAGPVGLPFAFDQQALGLTPQGDDAAALAGQGVDKEGAATHGR